jgi:CubicO group peptidase (beta-lactamase class C family)
MVSDTVDEALDGGGRIEGHCAPEFAGVLDAFRANFVERREAGASVCITREGTTLVDLWGGIAEPATGRRWERDTLCVVYSCTKGAAALVANMLAERGAIDMHEDVAARLWPDFGRNGKAGTTLAMMLSHASPVPGLRDPIRPGGILDWDHMVDRVAAEPAWWAPGTGQGYHALTYAWTVGQVVRLAAGKPLGHVFREEIAEPLGLDFWIGLPAAHEPRVVPLIAPDPAENDPRSRFLAAISEPGSLANLMVFNSGGLDVNAPEFHAAEIASGNGIANGRSPAGLYRPLANGGMGIVSGETIAAMARVAAATHVDATLRRPMRFGLGFMRSTVDPVTGGGAVIGEHGFGHVGSGGSIGFADPEARMSFGYAMNRSGPIGLLNDRGQTLVDAAYRSIGWSSRATGAWRA